MTVPIVLKVRTVTGRDTYGNDTYSTADVPVSGVFAPGGSTEQVDGREQVVTQPTVYLPATVDPTAVDGVVVGGVSYEVDGEPQVWPANPFTNRRPARPVVVTLRRVTG